MQKKDKVANNGKSQNREKNAAGARLKPVELPDIAHNGWKEWDDTLLGLKEYFRANFQDLESICPDPMKLTIQPAYKVYRLPEIGDAELEFLTKENDVTGIKR